MSTKQERERIQCKEYRIRVRNTLIDRCLASYNKHDRTMCLVLYCTRNGLQSDCSPKDVVTNHEQNHPSSTLRRSTVPCLPFSCWPSITRGGQACHAVWGVQPGLLLAYKEC